MRIWNASGAAERWKKAYTDRHGNWLFADAERREKTYNSIITAGDNEAKIDEAIGNNSWTRFHCAECDSHQHEGVEFDNWDGGIVVVCSNCLRSAVAMTTRIPNEE